MNRRLAALLLRGTFAGSGWRMALTLACIALGVALAGAVHTIHASALAEIDRAARALSGAADLEIRGPRSGFDERVLVEVASLPGVAAASPVVEVEAGLADDGGTLRVLGIDAFRAVQLQPAFVQGAAATGSWNLARLLDLDGVWLSPPAAARLGLSPGDTLRLASGTAAIALEVSGILEGLAGAGDVAVVDIAAAQSRFDRLGRLSRIELRLTRGAEAARVSEGIDALLPPGVKVAPAAAAAGRAAAITRAYRVNLDALALVALATGAFLVFSTLALQAARRRQEFALLRALGVTRRGLAALLAGEGALIGSLGAMAGTLLGLAASRAMLARVGGDLGAGYFGNEAAAFRPDAAALLAIALLAAATSAGAAGWVARQVARIPVAEALHDRAVDLPGAGEHAVAWAVVLAAAGVPMLLLPPVGGLPLGVARELEVAAAGNPAVGARVDRAFPVEGPGARARVELLVVHQGLDAPRAVPDAHFHGHRVLDARARRLPAAQRREPDRIAAQGSGRTARGALRAAGPQGRAGLVPDAESHHRAAIIEVHAEPVPARGLGGDRLAGPLVVEPGHPLDLEGAAFRDHAPVDREMRLAVVVAGVGGRRPLAGEAAIALEQDRLRRREAKVEGKVLAVDLRAVVRALPSEPPVVDAHVGVARGRLHHALERAAAALRVEEARLARIGEGGMGEQHLLRGEAAGIRLRGRVAHAEERDLEPEPPGRIPFLTQMAGHVPPLDAVAGMRAGVAGEFQRSTRHDRVEGERRNGGEGGERRGGRPKERPHASSFTARIASCRTASAALARAPPAQVATIAATSASRTAAGQWTSMLQ
jgi:ABC-type lipoprotein release transport system permease subunit